MIPASDAQLVPRLIAQEESAVETLLERYWARVYGVTWHVLGDPAAAEDAAQEAFIQVLSGIRQLKDPTALRPWLFRIALNTARKHQRSTGRRAVHEAQAREAPPSSSPFASANQEEQSARVREHVGSLSPKLQAAVTLRYLCELSLQECADALEVPLDTLASRVRRGLESLRRSLIPEAALPAVAPALLLEALRAASSAPPPSAPTAVELLAAAGPPPPSIPAPPPAEAILEGGTTPSLLLPAAGSLGLLLVAGLATMVLVSEPPTKSGATARVPTANDPETPGSSGAGEEPDGAGSSGSGEPVSPVGAVGATPLPAAGGETTSDPVPADAAPQPSQVRFSGRVLDAKTLAPIPGARVTLGYKLTPFKHRASFGKSNNLGQFQLEAPEHSRYTLTVQAPGHQLFARALAPAQAARPLDLLVDPGAGFGLRIRVVDEDGAGVAGLTLLGSVDFRGQSAGSLLGERSSPPPVSGSVGITVDTDASGRVALDGLPAGEVMLMGHSTTFVLRESLVPTRRDPAEVTLVASWWATLILELVDGAGLPLQNAIAWLGNSGHPIQDGRAVMKGFTPRAYELRIHPKGSKSYIESAPWLVERVTIRRGTQTLERRVIRPGGTIVAHLRRSGGPAADYEVYLYRDAEPRWERPVKGVTKADGSVQFDAVPLGHYALYTSRVQAAERTSGGPGSPKTPVAAWTKLGEVDVLEGEPAELTATVEEPNGPVTGTVVDSAGKPISKARVWFQTVVGRRWWPGQKVDANGRFRVNPFPMGLAVVRVTAPGYQRPEQVLRIPLAGPLRLVLEPARKLTVRISVASGSELDGALLTCAFRHLGSRYVRRTTLHEGDSELTFDSLPPGTALEAVVRVVGRAPRAFPVAAGATELNVTDLAFTHGHTLRLRFSALPRLGYAIVELRTEEGWFFPNFLRVGSARDDIRLSGLPDGALKLRFVAYTVAGRYRAELDVRAGSVPGGDLGEISLVPEGEPNAIRVTVYDPQGSLAKAGFQSGDVITGLDGATFRDVAHLTTGLSAAMRSDQATFQVRRGAVTTSLSLSTAATSSRSFELIHVPRD